ncbi:endo-alpha-N-acetylgalactosaminidase family protein [Streptomyces sp. RKAG337]|uniref:endo-alpha-N-acetylgalactosaminidase family protein n=1 Tax=Streptomyces sp. RKAG337 TaxID=2893404 RepID=UPI002033DC67|nr:endo-alpha-N-acetylgalactosaminidase family protein [Streptomyces sp. RKAG337]MCM2429035.1 endo-alpha-N-acetylgalactosaminidase family protein [Streptomyces sp. RKAG337]
MSAPETSMEAGPSRRAVVLSTAAAGLAAALVPGQGSAAAATAATGQAVIRSAHLDVRVHTAFPGIASYTDRGTGAVIHGAPAPASTLLIDGAAHTPRVTSTVRADRVTYTLALDGGTRIEAQITVDGWTAEFRVTAVADTDSLRVGTLQIPGLRLLSVRSDQPGATLLAAKLQLDKATSGDTLVRVTATTPAEAAATGCAYAVVATDALGAAIESNTVYDKPVSAQGTTWENGRFWRQTLAGDGWIESGLAPGQWTHRAAGAATTDTEPLPYAKVIVTRDRNGDGKTDWQDAAIALRDIAVTPLGADTQHLRVVPHIPFNFASQATNPFLATLDNVKRISLATDGLRQFTLLKGYQSEGHDSAHPDYGGNYNRRAGGLADLNTLVARGARWNSDFAVHVNATESYPVANAFSDQLVDKTDKQWDWLDQSYRINARRDLISGDIAARFQQLRDETHPALNTIYLDVFRESGWTSDRLQRHLRAQGWTVTSEWGHGLERSSLWSHWANETDYGGDTSRGINSQLIRMVRHHQKDVFADKWPLLGTAKLGTFEGWVGKTDWNAFYRTVWTENLPAKYLQAYPISTWTDHEITFSGPTATSVTDADGTKTITTDGRTVYRGGGYLLPWEPRQAKNPPKLYHYNPAGGASTWRLPAGWAAARTISLYRLTDQGRRFAGDLPVRAGSVTVTADAGQPYVVYRDQAPRQAAPGWGEGTAIHDPGFHSGRLDDWHVNGPATVVRNPIGDYELVIGAGPAAFVGQRLSRLRPGSYAASVQVEIGATAGERRRAALEVRTADGVTAVNWTDTSTAGNYVAADRKHGSRMQRMFTWFTVPEGGGPVTLALSADEGTARVTFDNVRVVAALPTRSPGALVHEDFENVPQGWGAFVKGDAGDVTDPRTHIAQRHSPFTQAGWNGKVIDDIIDGTQSLKSRGENDGLIYRTVPHTARFTPGRRYRVTFRYENEEAGQYAWITATDRPETTELSRTVLPAARMPATHSYEFTAPADGDAWVGLRKAGDSGTAEFSLDTFTVTDLGPA